MHSLQTTRPAPWPGPKRGGRRIVGLFLLLNTAIAFDGTAFNGIAFNRTVIAETVISKASDDSAGSDTTSITELRRTTSEQLRIESTTESGPAKDAAAAALCDLYVVLKSDPRFEQSPMLQGQSAKVRRRLLSIAKRRENQLNREGKPRPPGLSRSVETALKEASRQAAAGTAQHQRSAGERPLVRDTGAGGAGGGALADPGWGLVELIQRVVAPDFWSDRGGNGTIQYFATRRLLVVRATSDVHQQVKELLTALR